MSFEKIGVSGNLKSLVKRKTSLDCLDTWPDQATCEDTHMPIFAEKGISSTEQDVAPDQKEEAKANSCRNSSFRKTLRNKYYLQALVRNVLGPRTCMAMVILSLQMSYCFSVSICFIKLGYRSL